MPVHAPTPRPLLRLVGVAAAVLLAATTLSVPVARADVTRLDPAALPRGADPAVPRLVRDRIRDGARTVPATRAGRHDALWVVAGGYVVRDYNVGPRRLTRVVFIDRAGQRREVARSRAWIDVAVSTDGTRLAWTRPSGAEEEQRTTVTVERPRTGRVVAQRTFRLTTLVAVTGTRVLLARRLHWRDPATVWWNLGRDRVRRLVDQAATSADVRHDKIVLARPGAGEFCLRVAVLSDPATTLWRDCLRRPYRWSPDGAHAVATWTYFDAAGTDRWWVVDGSTGVRQSRVTGRLDWHAVWEDDEHWLTLAQSDTGRAAVVRCDLTGACERASRLWDVPLPAEPSLYYAAPPVVLAQS